MDSYDQKTMKTKFAIIGGGIAGLSAAIRLSELGETPMLIEGGTYPTHKVCGEFLSPECLPILNDWHIYPVLIPQVKLRTLTKSHLLSFPSPAAGLSHLMLDPALAKLAKTNGVHIKTNTQVNGFKPKEHAQQMHQIQLSTGEILEASHVLIATGRIPSYSVKMPTMSYMGFKAHFKNIPSTGNLEMFSFSGAYLGVSPVEDNQYNVACLAKLSCVEKYAKPHLFIEQLISLNPSLNACLSQGENLFGHWMMTKLPDFGIKHTPDWLDVYFIGDASVTIPPASGDGLAMAVLGGRLSAEYAVDHRYQEFKKVWTKRCSSQMFFAKLLHQVMLNPQYGTPMMGLLNCFPYFSRKIFDLTRTGFKNRAKMRNN